jgi:hypothetical protein
MSAEGTKLRKWTDEEVGALVEFIKTKRPRFWEQLSEIERSGSELGPTWDTLSVLVTQAHPNLRSHDHITLKFEVRKRLWKQLGL